MNLYLTADKIGLGTGGGTVVHYEWQAFRELPESQIQILTREELDSTQAKQTAYGYGPHEPEPWCWDRQAYNLFNSNIKLAHLYAGTFPTSIKKLKENDAKVSYTIAAHNLKASRAEHEKWGIPFAQYYPHLVQPDLWQKYIEGYRLADVIVAPSKAAENSIREYGGDFLTKRIEIIPHGVEIPATVKPLPKPFVVGYLGAYTPDKGITYLLQAWGKLNYKDAILVLGGANSATETVWNMVERYCGNATVAILGYVRNVADFYNGISLYVQPSITEGFGLEVAEAMSYARPVLVSRGAGAADMVSSGTNALLLNPGDVDDLCNKIDHARTNWGLKETGESCREVAKQYAWPIIQEKYKKLWQELMV